MGDGTFVLWMLVTCAVMAAVTAPFVTVGHTSDAPSALRKDGSVVS